MRLTHILLAGAALALTISPSAADQARSGGQVHHYTNGHQYSGFARYVRPQVPRGATPIVTYLGRPHYLMPDGRMIHADHLPDGAGRTVPGGAFYYSTDPYDHRH